MSINDVKFAKWDKSTKMLAVAYMPAKISLDSLQQRVAELDGQWVALLTFSAAAFHLKLRERWIRWAPRQRARRLLLVVNNSRFLVLPERARYLYVHQGLDKVEVESAEAGDIIALAGLEGITIGDTLADPMNPIALPRIKVEEPTVRMTFGVNTSPFSGREGEYVQSRMILERLEKECRLNVALRTNSSFVARSSLNWPPRGTGCCAPPRPPPAARGNALPCSGAAPRPPRAAPPRPAPARAR